MSLKPNGIDELRRTMEKEMLPTGTKHKSFRDFSLSGG
jgi:hypothetical protein